MERIWQQHYDGKPTEIESGATITEMFDEAVARWGTRPAFRLGEDTLGFDEVAVLSRDFAAWLQARGVRKGDRVAVMMPNLLAFPVVAFGIIRAGAVMVSVNPLYTPRELAHQLRDSGADTIIVFNGATPTLDAALGEVGIANIVTLGLSDFCAVQGDSPAAAPAVAARATTLAEAMSVGADLPFDPPLIAPDDLLFLQYTGGTTGLAKGAMLTHKTLMTNVMQFEWMVHGHMCPGDEIVITALPLYHVFGLMVNFLCFFKQGALNVLIANPRDAEGFVREWSKYQVTSFTGVNTLFVGLMNTPGFADCDFSRLRIAFGGGAPVQVAVSQRWKEITGIPICEGYGLTETGPIISANVLGRERYGTVGIPIPSTEIKLLTDDDSEAAIGEPGEICVRGPQVMKGYWRREDTRHEAFTEDNYFRTGDVGQFDADGYLRVVDRKKDTILVSGFNVYPNEIEDVLARMQGLVETAAVGVPDPHSGESVKAFCVRRDPGIDAEQVIAHCRRYLTGYKVPRQVAFVDALPKSTVGKILRRELRDR